MGWQVIKQPNGKFAIWSTVVDHFIYYDGTKEQIINAFVDQEKKRIEERLKEVFDDLDKGRKPYLQFTKTFDSAISTIIALHGKKEADDFLNKLDEKTQPNTNP